MYACIFLLSSPFVSIYGMVMSAASPERRKERKTARVCFAQTCARLGLRLDLCAAYVCVWLHTVTAHVCDCVGGLGAQLHKVCIYLWVCVKEWVVCTQRFRWVAIWFFFSLFVLLACQESSILFSSRTHICISTVTNCAEVVQPCLMLSTASVLNTQHAFLKETLRTHWACDVHSWTHF